MFKPVSPKLDVAKMEEDVLKFWKQQDIFKKTTQANEDGKEYVFYEGPPTANGKPGVHHVLARAFKDMFPRYKIMQGYHVSRRGGWDTHGLPVEVEVENEVEPDEAHRMGGRAKSKSRGVWPHRNSPATQPSTEERGEHTMDGRSIDGH